MFKILIRGKTNKMEEILLVFLFIFIIFMILILFSKIRLEIKNIDIVIEENDSNKFDIVTDYILKIKICIFNFLPIFKFKLTKDRMKKLSGKMKFSNYKNEISIKNIKEILSILDIKVKKINLKIDIGLENIYILSMLIPFICTIISFILLRQKIKIKNTYYKVNPLYNFQNLLKIKCNGIFDIKLIHIIYIIYIIKKKGRVNKNDRASYRRSYGYSYE